MKPSTFKYTIRRSQRARKTRIIVTPEKIEVVAPLRVSEGKIHAFVKTQQDWVIAATDKMEKKRKAVKKLFPDSYTDGVVIPFHGKLTKIRLKSSSSKKVKIEFNGEEFIINLPSENITNDKSELIKLSLIDWMKKQVFEEVRATVELHAKKYKLYPRLIKIKTQKSRWGSCGIHNDINLNWKLIFTPPKVLEYVVVHEICHIKERNHSVRFWLLVEKHLPDYKKQRKWLKQNGGSLMQSLK